MRSTKHELIGCVLLTWIIASLVTVTAAAYDKQEPEPVCYREAASLLWLNAMTDTEVEEAFAAAELLTEGCKQ